MVLSRIKQFFNTPTADPRGIYPSSQLKDIILFVTDRCNMKCDHCMFWERIDNPGDEHSLEELEKMAASIPPLRTVSITGGEPFLRSDLERLVEIFYKMQNDLRPSQIRSHIDSKSITTELKVDTEINQIDYTSVNNRLQNYPLGTTTWRSGTALPRVFV